MSDEFLKVATKEINDELARILEILNSCSNENDVFKNSNRIEQSMHKIKGLAPMMGKENVGTLAKSLDGVLKKLVSGKKLDGFFEPLTHCVLEMKIAMEESHDLDQAQQEISDIASKIMD